MSGCRLSSAIREARIAFGNDLTEMEMEWRCDLSQCSDQVRGLNFRQDQRCLFFPERSFTHPPVQLVQGLRRAGLKADTSLTSNSEIKNAE